MNYKAIETHYKGYRFRSRLEARWAVFFDTAGIEYQYEKEGFELSDGTRYLPDFYIPVSQHDRDLADRPKGGIWIEIKGDKTPSEAELNKLRLLNVMTDQHCRMFCGAPGEQEVYIAKWGIVRLYSLSQLHPVVQLIGVLPSSSASYKQLKEAITAARSARFEFGETP